MQKLLLFILLFLSISSYAQFEEQFTDGGFNVNPHWDTLGTNFIVVNQILNLQATQNSGKAAIVTTDTLAKSVEWNLYLRLGFQPTDNDKVEVVLMSNQMDIRNAFNGYFVRIGENGGSDALDFYRRDGSNDILIKKMLIGNFQNGADGNLKVVKNNLGKWVFYWKNINQPDYIRIDSTQELTYSTTTHFGMLCTYTAASKDSFWFDDIYSKKLPLVSTDAEPPTVLNIELINRQQINILFSEPVDSVSAKTALNYLLSTGIGNPTSIAIDASNKQLIHLYFTVPLASKTHYTITIDNVRDTIGNEMLEPSVVSFVTSYYAVAGDVLINEIMAKPSATGALPNKQYIELVNVSNDTIQLKNWTLNEKLFTGNCILLPDSVIILCNNADTITFKPYGKTVGVNSWALLASEGFINIKSEDNISIDTLTYNNSFYKDAQKLLGGWSMELNEEAYFRSCQRFLYWSASSSLEKGSPGQRNLWYMGIIPTKSTDSLIADNIIEVRFPNFMQKSEVENIGNYSMDNGISIESVITQDADAKKVWITLNSAMDSNIIYHLKVNEMNGCINVTHSETVFEIALTAVPQQGDIILNEILFQPNAGGEQFVELYNRTNKLFKLKDLKITQANVITGGDNQVLNLANISGYIFPYDYLVLTKNKTVVKTQYGDAVFSKMFNVDLPTYDEQEDIVVMKNSEDRIVDKLQYHVNWHFPLLNTTRGVSLEKSGFDFPQSKRYWHSASQDVGYATPGYLNSDNTYEFQGEVQIIPEVFSPDGDGIDDEAKITYSFDNDGSVVNVYLYNADGRLANHLQKDVAIPKEGVFIWNGDDENGNKKDVGIYFLVFERKNPDGEKIIYKRKCVLAAKLN